ncbi:nephrin-like isoform X2 [Lytechinus variegatus]|uniref:nephrin-like isoform X2 n=1 Tax=Lytechinus variegatus TaxID=7654 RepID=UPI001BB11910|nr:nephrin-like isoform X2 [Lytechinus variegatus]
MKSISTQVVLVLFLGVIISQSAPPTWIYIIDGKGVRYYFNNLSITVKADQRNDITCEAYGANPPSVLDWHVPDDIVIDLQDQSDVIEDGSYISRKAVTITPTRDDHKKILSCIASHPELQNERLRSVHLNVHVLPRDVLLFQIGGNQNYSTVLKVQEDSPTSITCKSIGSFPATKLLFQLVGGTGQADNTPLRANISSKRSVLDDKLFDSEGTITIHPNIERHGKYIYCYASLEKHIVGFKFAKVIVYGPPEGIKITSPMDLYDGIEVNVTCKAVNGYPAPHIHWYIGLRNLTEDSDLNIIENEAGRYDAKSILNLIPTRFDHGKSLLCEAVQPTTHPARSVNQSLVMNITYHPVVIIKARHLTSNKASGTTKLVLTCKADANPPVNTFVWLCNETVVSNDTNYRLTETIYEDTTLTSSVLAIQNPLSKYHCVYKCTALSEYDSRSAEFNSLYLYFIPNPPSDFIIHRNQTRSSSLFVAWQPGSTLGSTHLALYH